jgi:hypothetical protein
MLFSPNLQSTFFRPASTFCHLRKRKIFGFTTYPFLYEPKLQGDF